MLQKRKGKSFWVLCRVFGVRVPDCAETTLWLHLSLCIEGTAGLWPGIPVPSLKTIKRKDLTLDAEYAIPHV